MRRCLAALFLLLAPAMTRAADRVVKATRRSPREVRARLLAMAL
jgi:hypothetical protein